MLERDTEKSHSKSVPNASPKSLHTKLKIPLFGKIVFQNGDKPQGSNDTWGVEAMGETATKKTYPADRERIEWSHQELQSR